jgi:hypothetical protein
MSHMEKNKLGAISLISRIKGEVHGHMPVLTPTKKSSKDKKQLVRLFTAAKEGNQQELDKIIRKNANLLNRHDDISSSLLWCAMLTLFNYQT